MSPTRRWLLPFVPLYRLGLAISEIRSAPPRRLRWPVVSIGNLSTGGAGKTPLTIALAKALTARGLHVDVLSRGYGRRSRLPACVDPSGSAEEFGDEPLVITREAGVPVYVAADRYQAGMMAEAAQPTPSNLAIHILDDGFQHRQLARDIDILLLDRRDWRDSLLPAGNLREPLSAARRASVIAIPADDSQLEADLKALGWQGTVWQLHRRMAVPKIEGPVAAFCGIARPEQFFKGLEAAGLHLASQTAFPDHHRYIQYDLDCLLDAARNVRATAFITTEKDRSRLGDLMTKLTGVLPLRIAQLRIEFEDEQSAVDWLIARCSSAAHASFRV
jgi:tetraacyldisaccharide 4'-kinase